MARQYTKVQELWETVLKLKTEGKTNREIGEMYGLTKEQIEELGKRERRRQRRIAAGYIPQPKGRPRKRPVSEAEQRNHEVAELRMKVELLRNFLSEVGRR